jgi:hypothetical protein
VLPLYSSPFLHGAQPSYLIAIFGEGIDQETDMIKIPRLLLERFTEALCYAA